MPRETKDEENRSTRTSKDVFVWTEIYNCGEVGRVAIESYLANHAEHKVHVYGFEEDLKDIADNPLVVKMKSRSGFFARTVSRVWTKFGIGPAWLSEESLRESYSHAHLGTARLWAFLLMTRPETKLVHFDSDVIFLGAVVDDIVRCLQTASLVGPVRNYRCNSNNRDDVRYLPDLTQMACFGFDKSKVGKHRFHELVQKCRGYFSPKGHPVIGLFDPVMFEIIGNGGTLNFLPHDEVGDCNVEGNRRNAFSEINNFETLYKIDFGSKLGHFSAVGSGMNFHKDQRIDVHETYRRYALDRFALYSAVFLNKDIGVDLSAYSSLMQSLRRIDTRNWKYA